MRLNNQSYEKDLCQNLLNRFGFEELYQAKKNQQTGKPGQKKKPALF